MNIAIPSGVANEKQNRTFKRLLFLDNFPPGSSYTKGPKTIPSA